MTRGRVKPRAIRHRASSVPPVTVHLVDASPYLFRAYFALPELSAPDKSPVGAVYGFAAFLIRYVREHEPTHLGIAFDASLTTSFRNDLYPAYKSTRALPPPELEAQQQRCRDVARALGAAVFDDARYEADDLIGTLAHRLEQDGRRVVVVSSDKDLCQLVSAAVTVFDFARDARFGPAEVRAKFGVRPDQMADYLGLAGDSVDSIPGVRGIGKQTAAALLAEFESLDALYADLERVAALPIRGAKSLAAKLAQGRDAAFLSRTLARIALDAPVEATLGDLEYRGADPELATALFERLGLGTLAQRIPPRR